MRSKRITEKRGVEMMTRKKNMIENKGKSRGGFFVFFSLKTS